MQHTVIIVHSDNFALLLMISLMSLFLFYIFKSLNKQMRCGNTVLSCLKLLAQAEGKISFYDIFEGVYFQM